MPLMTPDIPFSKDEGNRFMPWIIAFMVFLTGMLLLISISLSSSMTDSSRAYEQLLGVHVPANDTADARVRAEKIVALLQETNGIKKAYLISEEHVKNLVEPWLGSSDAIGLLPLPAMIEAQLDTETPVDMVGLKTAIANIAPEAQLDDHQQWLSHYQQATQSIQWTVLFIAALLITVTAAIVIFAAKTTLSIHKRTVILLHSMGAFDQYIARQFQQNAFLVALKGAALGTAAAALIYALLSSAITQMKSELLPSFTFSSTHIILLALLPFITASISMLAARYSVFSELKRII